MHTLSEVLVVLVYEDKEKLSLSNETTPQIRAEITRSIASLDEVNFVKHELEREGFNVEAYEIDEFCTRKIHQLASDNTLQPIIWNVTDGEIPFKGGSIPAVSRLFRLPYLGSSSFVRGVCNAKHIWKSQIAGKVPVPNHFVVYEASDLDELPIGFDYPMFVKPSRYGNSAGISLINPVVRSFTQLQSVTTTLLDCQLQPILVEPFLSGTEFAVAAIHSDEWQLKVFKKSFPDEYLLPQVKDGSRHHEFSVKEIEHTQLRDLTLKAIRMIGIKDYARFDFRTDQSGNLHLIDINSGCFLLGSTMRDFIASMGSSFGDGFGNLIQFSLSRQEI